MKQNKQKFPCSLYRLMTKKKHRVKRVLDSFASLDDNSHRMIIREIREIRCEKQRKYVPLHKYFLELHIL